MVMALSRRRFLSVASSLTAGAVSAALVGTAQAAPKHKPTSTSFYGKGFKAGGY